MSQNGNNKIGSLWSACIESTNKTRSFNTALEGMTQRVTLETTKLVVWGLQRKTRSFKSALEGVIQGYTGSKMEKV